MSYKFKRELNAFIGEKPRFNEPLKRRILLKIKEENKPRASAGKRVATLKYTAIFRLLKAVVTSFLILTLKEWPNPAPAPPGNLVLTNSETVAEIEIFPGYEEPLEVFDFRYDAMDRGSHEYAAYPLLIDPLAYEGKGSVERGCDRI